MSVSNIIQDGVLYHSGDLHIGGIIVNDDLNYKITGGGGDYTARLNALDASMGELRNAVSFITNNADPAQIDSIGEMLADYKASDLSLVSLIQTNYNTLDARVDGLDTSNGLLEARVNVIDNSLNEVSSLAEGTFVSLGLLDARVGNNETSIGAIQQNYDNVLTSVSTLETDVDVLQTTATSTASQIVSLISNVNGLSGEIDTLKAGGVGGGGGISSITMRNLPRKYITGKFGGNYTLAGSGAIMPITGRQGRITPSPTSTKWWNNTIAYDPGDTWSNLLTYDIDPSKNYIIDSSVVAQQSFVFNTFTPENTNNFAELCRRGVRVGSGFYLVDTDNNTHYIDPLTNQPFPFEVFKAVRLWDLADLLSNTTISINTSNFYVGATNSGALRTTRPIRVKNQMFLDNKTRSIKFKRVIVCVSYIDGFYDIGQNGEGGGYPQSWNKVYPFINLYWGNVDNVGGSGFFGTTNENTTHTNTYIDVVEIDY